MGHLKAEAAARWPVARNPLPMRSPAPSARTALPCTVRVVRPGDAALEKVMAVRAQGFAKFLGPDAEAMDAYDHQPHCYHLLAEDHDGRPVGAGRFIMRRAGSVEIDSWVDLDRDPRLANCFEGTRFTVPFFAGAALAKLALWKAGHLLALELGVETLMAPVRISAKRDYDRLMFEDSGLRFLHPRDAQRREHYVVLLNLNTAQRRYRAANHPLYDFFFTQAHPEIRLFD